MLVKPLTSLRLGMTLFFSALTGNAYDRAIYGSVLDFIRVSFLNRFYFFNLSDAFMWLGLGIIIFEIFKNDAQIWHPETKRKSFLINQSYQFKRALNTALVSLSSSLVLILFSFTYVAQIPQALSHTEKVAYLVGASTLSTLFSLVTVFASLVFSHRSAGPLFAFERYMQDLTQGKDYAFTLRDGDEHQNLVDLAERLRIKILKNENKMERKHG